MKILECKTPLAKNQILTYTYRFCNIIRMNTKLTLSIDSVIIDKAKRELQTNGKSLSAIIEDYFKLLIATKTRQMHITPVVAELTGIAKLNENIDEKYIIAEYLLGKYE